MSTTTNRAAILGLFGGLLGLAVAASVLITMARSSGEVPAHDPVPAPLSESEGAITEVAMHYVPAFRDVVRETYTDFLRALSDDVAVRIVVSEDLSATERRELKALIDSVDGSLWARSRLVTTPGPITTWSKDRALVTEPGPTGRAWLVAPSEPGRQWQKRYNDWLTVKALATNSHGRFERRIAPFDFDAGDFAVTRSRLIVDADLIEKNRHRGITSAGSLARRLRAWFKLPVIVLGQRPGDTPRHHLAMYMTPLHDDVVLVGDPRAARRLVGADFTPGAQSAETRQPLVADFSEKALARFDLAASELERYGYHVVRVPNVPLEDKTYITYTNGVYETRDGRRIAYLPVYGIPQLGSAARRVYENLGWEVRPVRVRRVYPLHGTIGCLVNVLARG